jgi:hypothetical protein
MNKFTRVLFVGALVIVASCGESSPSPDNEESTISKIVTAACIDLSNATTDAEAAQALSGAMQLSESIGVSNTDLGTLLRAACSDAINNAQGLP